MSDEVKATAEAILKMPNGIVDWEIQGAYFEMYTDVQHLKALARAYLDQQELTESHEKLLDAAKEMHDNLALRWQDDEYQKIFEQAAKLVEASAMWREI